MTGEYNQPMPVVTRSEVKGILRVRKQTALKYGSLRELQHCQRKGYWHVSVVSTTTLCGLDRQKTGCPVQGKFVTKKNKCPGGLNPWLVA